MIFGNETPFYLKPLPNRGLRRLDAEAQQHYPGYRHPLDYAANLTVPSYLPASLKASVDAADAANATSSGQRSAAAAAVYKARAMPGTSGVGYPKADPPYNPVYNISEAERTHRCLSPTDRLRHERELERAKADLKDERRRCRVAERERLFVRRQQEEMAASEAKAARMVGTTMQNVESEGRDTITHHCFTLEAQQKKDFHEAAARHFYFTRVKRMDELQNTSGFNILTWRPRKTVVVPPMPLRPGEQPPLPPQEPPQVNIESFE